MCHEALSRMRMFRFLMGVIDSAASSRKTWKTSRIAMACFYGEELPVTGTDGPKDIQTDMITIMHHPGL